MQAQVQNSVTARHNCPRGGDILRLCEIDPISPGCGGECAVWDLSGISGGHPATKAFSADSAGLYEVFEGRRTAMESKDGMLVATGIESPLTTIGYDIPKLKIPASLAFGDSVTIPYSGSGIYSGKFNFEVSGRAVVKADASGCVVLPCGDTITGVIRVSTVYTHYIRMASDPSRLNAASPVLEAVDKNDWYARGCRYPLLSTEARTSYDSGVAVASTSRAFLCIPDSQSLAPDPENELLLAGDTLPLRSTPSSPAEIIHYSLHDDGAGIVINFDLDSDEELEVVLCDVNGMVRCRHSEWKEAGSGQTLRIDHSSITHGNYVLYIRAGAVTHNEKFTKL